MKSALFESIGFDRNSRREFLAGSVGACLGTRCSVSKEPSKSYKGANLILIRFGGGVRRAETIREPHKTYCPFLIHEMAGKHGVLLPKVEIASDPGVETSHGQGTLYILTGRYDKYKDITGKFLSERFVPQAPTLFEYFRQAYDIPAHKAILINGEDRPQEEFFSFSNNHLFGVQYRCQVLSLYRYKLWLTRRQLAEKLDDATKGELVKKLKKLEEKNYRGNEMLEQSPGIDEFWQQWRNYYGDSGLVNPRGDQLLTELALQAIEKIQPRMLMINYQDPDYVHWGPPAFYTRSISIIDDGIKRIWNAVQVNERYRDNTVFAVVPDCGRDHNRATSVPFQHHFGSKSSREIFAIFSGPGIGKGTVLDQMVDQIDIAPTLAKLMGFETAQSSGKIIHKILV